MSVLPCSLPYFLTIPSLQILQHSSVLSTYQSILSSFFTPLSSFYSLCQSIHSYTSLRFPSHSLLLPRLRDRILASLSTFLYGVILPSSLYSLSLAEVQKEFPKYLPSPLQLTPVPSSSCTDPKASALPLSKKYPFLATRAQLSSASLSWTIQFLNSLHLKDGSDTQLAPHRLLVIHTANSPHTSFSMKSEKGVEEKTEDLLDAVLRAVWQSTLCH
jgi:hypothetical protein